MNNPIDAALAKKRAEAELAIKREENRRKRAENRKRRHQELEERRRLWNEEKEVERRVGSGVSKLLTGLGHLDGNEFVLGNTVMDSLRDLFSRVRSGSSRQIETYKLLLRWDIINKKIVPLLSTAYVDGDIDLVFHALKLIVALTLPLPEQSGDIVELGRAVRSKFALEGTDALIVSMNIVAKYLERATNAGHEEAIETGDVEKEEKTVELILTFLRNLLLLDEEMSFIRIRDSMATVFRDQNVFEILIFMTQSVEEIGFTLSWRLLLAEIIHLTIKSLHPANLIAVLLDPSSDEAPPVLDQYQTAPSRKSNDSALFNALTKAEISTKEQISLTSMRDLGGVYRKVSSNSDFVEGKSGGAVVTHGALPTAMKGPKRRAKPQIRTKRRFRADVKHGYAGPRDTEDIHDESLSRSTLRLLGNFSVRFIDGGCFDALFGGIVKEFAHTDRLLTTDRIILVNCVSFFVRLVYELERRTYAMLLEKRELALKITTARADEEEEFGELLLRIRPPSFDFNEGAPPWEQSFLDVDFSSVSSVITSNFVSIVLDYVEEATAVGEFNTIQLESLANICRAVTLLANSRDEENVRFADSMIGRTLFSGRLINETIRQIRNWRSTKHGLSYIRALVLLFDAALRLISVYNASSATSSWDGVRGERFNTEIIAEHLVDHHFLEAYRYCVSKFYTNSPDVNKALARFLSFLSKSHKLSSAFYNVSFLSSVSKVLALKPGDGEDGRGIKKLQEAMGKIAVDFLIDLERHPWLCPFIPFWLDKADVFLISGHAEKAMEAERKRRTRWKKSEAENLKALFSLHGNSVRILADAVGKSERAVMQKLNSLGLVSETAIAEPMEADVELGRIQEQKENVGEVSEERLGTFVRLLGSESFSDASLVLLARELEACVNSRSGEGPHARYPLIPVEEEDFSLLEELSTILAYLDTDSEQHLWNSVSPSLTNEKLESLVVEIRRKISPDHDRT